MVREPGNVPVKEDGDRAEQRVSMVSVFVLPAIMLAVGILLVYLGARGLKASRPQPQELMTPDGVPVVVNVAQPGRTKAVVVLIIGIAATTIASLLLIAIVAFWNEFSDFSKCTEGANTTQGQQSCTDQFETSVKDRLGQ